MHDLYVYAFKRESEEKKAAFHVMGVFQAHMCIALQAFMCHDVEDPPKTHVSHFAVSLLRIPSASL